VVGIEDRIRLGHGCYLDLRLQQLIKGGTAIPLSGLEFRLLRRLAEGKGSVVPHDELIRAAWGQTGVISLHELHEYIHRLRMHLGDDPNCPVWLATIHGVGYALHKQR
jgi:two-component system KDP operon response regulator KdpE